MFCCNSEKWLKSVYIYGSYRKIKTRVSLFAGPLCRFPTKWLMIAVLKVAVKVLEMTQITVELHTVMMTTAG